MPSPVITAGTPGTQSDNAGVSVVAAMPSGVLVGDVLVAVVAIGALVTVTDSTGHWTQVQSAVNNSNFQKLVTFKRIATGTENSTYTFTYFNNGRSLAVIARATGASDVDVSAFTSTQSGTSLTWPGVTTTAPDCALLMFTMNRNGATATPPAGVTQVATAAIAGPSLYVHKATQATAGASTFGAGTWSASVNYCTQTIAIASSGDLTPPTVPAGLTVTATTDRSVSLSWTAVTSPDLAGYRVYRNGTLVSTQTGTTVTVGDLPGSTSFTWTVTAFDLVDNESAPSPGVTGATSAVGPVAKGLGYSGTIFEKTPLPSPFIDVGPAPSWNAYQNREHGNAVVDPADPDANRRYKFCWSGLNYNGGAVTLGIAFSGDGLTWTQHPGNPVSGVGTTFNQRGEDPYIAKHIDTGYAYRDSGGRLLMFAEEKPTTAETQRGVVLYRSSDNGMTWAYHSRVLDRNPVAAQWDSTDRTSPTVFHDGTQLVMFFEGRNFGETGGVINNGEVGVAYSTNDGLTWTVGNGGNPIITTASVTTWANNGIVCDDILLIGGAYYLTCHGQTVGAGGGTSFNHIGRWKCVNLDPSTWSSADFIEMPGNPFDTASSTEMLVGNDGARIITERNRLGLYLTTLEGISTTFVGWGTPL